MKNSISNQTIHLW